MEHKWNTNGTQMEHNVTQMEHNVTQCNTSGTQVEYKLNTNGTQVEHKWNTSGTQMEHKWNTNGTQMEHRWFCVPFYFHLALVYSPFFHFSRINNVNEQTDSAYWTLNANI